MKDGCSTVEAGRIALNQRRATIEVSFPPISDMQTEALPERGTL